MQIEGYQFAGPYFHTRLFNNDFGCVYVLINRANQVVDVGETGSINSRMPNHERKTCWYQHACGDTGLYVFVSGDENFRRALEGLIRVKYRPPCGQR